MKKVGWCIFTILMLLLGITAFAQETEQSCTSEQLQPYQDTLVEIASALATAENPLEILVALDAGIDAIRWTCTGKAYTSEDYGLEAVIGPVMFSGTLYKATLTSDTFASISVTAISGECDEFNLMTIGSFEGGEANTLYEFEECVAMFEINASKPWTFVIERIQ